MGRRTYILSGFATLGLLAGIVTGPSSAGADSGVVLRAARGDLGRPTLTVNGVTKQLPWFSAGLRVSALEASGRPSSAHTRGAPQSNLPAVQGGPQPATMTLGCATRNVDGQSPANVRVNQDCTYRRQAEESIAVNPVNPQNLVAGQNDSRIGYNHCGFDYSNQTGVRWGDGIPPFWQRLNNPTPPNTILFGAGTMKTYDFASDPAVTFDSRGNSYFSCITADINDSASGLFVTQSTASDQSRNTGTASNPLYPFSGSFYNNVGGYDPDTGQNQTYVVDEENPAANAAEYYSLDKEFIRADSFPNSPYRDNVYITFTAFHLGNQCGPTTNPPTSYCESPIYFSRSTDGGLTWSQPMNISGINQQLCVSGNTFNAGANPNACNFDQGSDPIVLPDGTIVVVFNNGNTPSTVNQQLAVVSTDGGRTFSNPVLVGRDVATGEPQCDFGAGPEECVPGQYARTDDFPRIAVDRRTGQVYATWQDYRTGRFGIQLSTSTDGGRTWRESAGPVISDPGVDDSQAAIDTNPKSGTIGISYYRTPQVPNQNSHAGIFTPSDPGVQAENSTYALSYGHSAAGSFARIFDSLPFPAPVGYESGFLGDYSGLAIGPNLAHPIWADTRNALPPMQAELAGGPGTDQDVFTQGVTIP